MENFSEKVTLVLTAMAAATTPEEFKKLQGNVKEILTAATDEIERLNESVDEYAASIDALSAEIEKLSKVPADYFKNKTAEKINPADHSFEIEGKKYGFNYPKQTHKGQVITPIEVKASTELQVALITSKSNMIKEL